MKRYLLPLLSFVLLAGCGSQPSDAPKVDPSTESWYAPMVKRLADMDLAAANLLKENRIEEAAAIVSSAQTLQTRLLSAPRPTLEAMQAIADLDQVYGFMLIHNGYFGEARMLFQKNITRWKTWKPQTPDTEERLKQAQQGIAECDKHMGG